MRVLKNFAGQPNQRNNLRWPVFLKSFIPSLFISATAVSALPQSPGEEQVSKQQHTYVAGNDTTGHSTIKARLKISARYQAGFIGDPAYNAQHIIRDYPMGANIELSTPLMLHKHETFAGTLHKGIHFFSIELGNPEVLGWVSGLVPYLEYTAFTNRMISPGIRLGMGLSYANKPHHRLHNHKNTLIGSHLNVALTSRLLFNMRLAKKIYWQTGLSVLHISNGNTSSPNDGINLFGVESGFSYHIPRNKSLSKASITPHAINRDNFMYLTGTMSVTNFQREVQTGYNYFTLMAEWVHQLHSYMGLGVGIDFTHNNAEMEKVTFDHSIPPIHNQLGIKGIMAVPLNNITFMLQIGVINIDHYHLYNWLVLRYSLFNNVYFNVSYRAYGFTGGHLGWGFGIKL